MKEILCTSLQRDSASGPKISNTKHSVWSVQYRQIQCRHTHAARFDTLTVLTSIPSAQRPAVGDPVPERTDRCAS